MIIRTFISIPIPPNDTLTRLLKELRQPGIRTTPESQMHLTLCFIGDVDNKKLPTIEKCVKQSVEGIKPSNIRLTGIGAFPNKTSPHIIWIGVKTELPLEQTVDSISAGLNNANIDHDHKKFRAHMTIGRTSKKIDITDILNKYKDTEFCIINFNSIKIMKSELLPNGAKYTPLYSVDLMD